MSVDKMDNKYIRKQINQNKDSFQTLDKNMKKYINKKLVK